MAHIYKTLCLLISITRLKRLSHQRSNCFFITLALLAFIPLALALALIVRTVDLNSTMSLDDSVSTVNL